MAKTQLKAQLGKFKYTLFGNGWGFVGWWAQNELTALLEFEFLLGPPWLAICAALGAFAHVKVVFALTVLQYMQQ